MSEVQIINIQQYFADQAAAHQAEGELIQTFIDEHKNSWWHTLIHRGRPCRRLEDWETRIEADRVAAERAAQALAGLEQGQYQPALETISERIRVLGEQIQTNHASAVGIGMGSPAIDGAYLDALTLQRQSEQAKAEIAMLNNFRRVLDPGSYSE